MEDRRSFLERRPHAFRDHCRRFIGYEDDCRSNPSAPRSPPSSTGVSNARHGPGESQGHLRGSMDGNLTRDLHRNRTARRPPERRMPGNGERVL